MKRMTHNQTGFTIIELMVAITIISAITMVAVINIRNMRAQNRDSIRKKDINSMYYQLESFHEASGYYPKTPDGKTLKGIDPASLVDNNGKTVNQQGSLYTYTPAGCSDNKCTSYSLSSELEKEAPFTKLSLIR